MKGLILCGGKGTRLRPYSYSRPKHLLPIANKPVIQYAVDKMKEAGILEIGIVVPPHFQSEFQSCLETQNDDVLFTYIIQHEAKGLAHAVYAAKSFVGNQPFVLLLGDNFFSGNLKHFVNLWETDKSHALLLVSHVNNPDQYGVVQFQDNRVLRVYEKPKNPPSSYAIIGVYLFTSDIFEAIDQISPSSRGEYEITDAIQKLIDTGHQIQVEIMHDWWRDTGTPTELLYCNQQVLLQLNPPPYDSSVRIESSTINGPVMIHERAKIIDSLIQGPAIIGPESTITRSYIGPYCSIEHNVLIEDSKIENSIILERTQIRKISNLIHGSIIGGDVVLLGFNPKQPYLQMNLGDHTKMYLPTLVENEPI